jgi:hypothetical protein
MDTARSTTMISSHGRRDRDGVVAGCSVMSLLQAVPVGRDGVSDAIDAGARASIWLSNVFATLWCWCARRVRPAWLALAATAQLFQTIGKDLLDPYRPELHYMRGPGPKWHAKHARGNAATPPRECAESSCAGCARRSATGQCTLASSFLLEKPAQ